jgi:hypothetical protein
MQRGPAMQGWRVNFFNLAASLTCSVLVACGGGGAAESGAQSAAETAPAPREVGAGLPPLGTGTGTLRDFTLQVSGLRVNPPISVNTSDELRVVPDASGALTSVVYWGDGTYSDIKGGWNAGTPASLMSHRYAAAGSYQIEYATRDPNQGWDARILQIAVVAGGASPPPPAPMSAGSNRALNFFVNGTALAAPFAINTSTALTVVPAATGAETSVIHWGDGTYSSIIGCWNPNTPTALTQHRYAAPATYRVEYATRYAGSGWDSMVREVTVVAGGAAAPAPAPAPTPAPAQPGSVWRPFNASSPWNTPIGASPALEADSASLISAFIRSTPFGDHLDVNIARFSIPLYQANASTPLQTVAVGLGGEGWGAGGLGASGPMPIPAGATPDEASDAHMAVITADRTREYGCFNMNFNRSRAGAWYADLCAISDLTGSGVRPPAT